MIKKDTNPKAACGDAKPGTFNTPACLAILVGHVMFLGAKKYGAFNWRKTGVRSSTYINAIQRHLDAWKEGQDVDPETQVSHLAHIAASCGVLLDAQISKVLNDDRVKGSAALVLRVLTNHIKKETS